jgi:EpsI family protein
MIATRYWTVVLLLIGAGTVIHLRGDTDRVPAAAPLSELPMTIGSWTGTESPLDQETLDVLGKGIFLNRVYQPIANGPQVSPASFGTAAEAENLHSADSGPVSLFIGYFPTQRTGQAIHSPQHCLPGAGWVFESSGLIDLKDPDGKIYQVGDYLISDGNTKAEVFYWYQSHGRRIASDYLAKFYTMIDSMRLNRTDAALIRVVTPVQKGETRLQARQRASEFTEHLTPYLNRYIPD